MLKLRPQQIPILATALVFVLLYVVASFTCKGFFSWLQFEGLLNGNATLGLVAIGMTFVILSGGIDLSVGAAIAMNSMLFATLLVHYEYSVGVAIPMVLAAGLGFGATLGAIIHWFRLPPFLVTLAGMFLARGIALVLTKESRISLFDHPTLGALSNWNLEIPVIRLGGKSLWTELMLPIPPLVFFAFLVLAIIIAHWTRFGRNVYAIGGDESSALLMGLPVGRTKIGVYALSGFCAAMAGVMLAIGTSAGNASAGQMFELDAIAAVVIGGTLLSGGVGYVLGTLLGVMILGIILIIPNYQSNLDSDWARVAIGVLLLAFIGLQSLLQKKASK